MSTPETSRFVRLRAELVLEVTDAGELVWAALDHISEDQTLSDEERRVAQAAVQEDDADALAYLVDPFDLVRGIGGMELAQASWSSERIDYDPDAVEWDLEGEEDGFGDVGWIGEDGERPNGEGDAGRP